MSYTAAVALGVVTALVVDLAALRTRLVTRPAFWTTYAIVLFFQLISNGVLSARGVIDYDPARILGLRVVYAPVEDVAFGFALVLTTLAAWVWLGARRAGRRPPSPAAPPAASSAPRDRDRRAAPGT